MGDTTYISTNICETLVPQMLNEGVPEGVISGREPHEEMRVPQMLIEGVFAGVISGREPHKEIKMKTQCRLILSTWIRLQGIY